MKNRFDIHVNLRAFPGSRRGQQQRDITPQEMAEYFSKHEITHALVLYNRDDYSQLEELASLTSTKCYGVQSLMGPVKEMPTDEKNPPVLDVNVEGRSFLSGGHCYGIKLASERGWWIKESGEIDSGLNYYKSKFVKKVLNQLPKNAIASFHTQGTSKPDNTSSPMMIANFAKNYPNVKFIINHGGDYGPSATVAKPSSKRILSGEGSGNLLRHISHRMVMWTGFECAEWYHNVFADLSCFTVAKGDIARRYTQWAAGSDFPFSEGFDINYSNERKFFEKYTDIPDDNAVNFFDKDVELLLEEQLDFYDTHYKTLNEEKNERIAKLKELSSKG